MADLIESNPTSNQNNSASLNGTTKGLSQGFTGVGSNLYSAKFYLGRYLSTTGNIYAKVYEITGDWGMGELPTGDPIATSDVLDASTLTTSYVLYELLFSGVNKINLIDDHHYALTIEYADGADVGPYVIVGLCSDENEGSIGDTGDGVNWFSQYGSDLCYYIYGTGPSASPSVSISLSQSVSVSASPSPSNGSSPSVSISASISLSPSLSDSLSPSLSYSASASPSPSPAFTCDLTQLTDDGLSGITFLTGADAYGQSFIPTSEYPIGKIQVSVERSGTITGSLRLVVMNSSAGLPNSIIDISNNTYSVEDLSEGVANHLDFHFDHNVFLDPDETYFIVLDGVDLTPISLGAGIIIHGSDVYSAEEDAYTNGKLMYTFGFDGIGDTWIDITPGGEGVLEWMDMYFKICYDPLAWSHSPSLSPSPSVSASISPSLTPSSSVSASVSPSSSLSPSPSRSQYEDSYAIKSTIWSDKYKKW